MKRIIFLIFSIFAMAFLVSCNRQIVKTNPKTEETNNPITEGTNNPITEIEETITIKFVTNCDEKIVDSIIKPNEKIKEPKTIEKIGYNFSGWFFGEKLWDFNNDVALGDMTLEAHWDPCMYTIKYVTDQGVLDRQEDKVYYNQEITLPIPTEADGFIGWYYNKKEVQNGPYTFTTDITLVARWEYIEMPIYSIKVTGPTQMFVGDAYSVQLKAIFTPNISDQRVIWKSNNESVATIDENGVVTGKTTGTARIKATSVLYEEIESSWFTIKIIEYTPIVPVDLKGYEIIIMDAESNLSDINPFLEFYRNDDKTYKQEAWREVEQEFNCTISTKPYPALAPYGDMRINWIIDNANNGTSEADLCSISSSWLHKFVKANAALDLSEYYTKYVYEKTLMQYESCVFDNKIYALVNNISLTSIYDDYGLLYNMSLVEKCGLKDPAKMFNDGEWTYTNFLKWLNDGKNALGEGEYAITTDPYYLWYYLTTTTGTRVVDTLELKVRVDTLEEKNAAALVRKIYEDGCTDGSTISGIIDAKVNKWYTGKSLMTPGYTYIFDFLQRQIEQSWGDDIRIGFVPLPYPDDQKKDTTRIVNSGLSLLMYCAGRSYPNGVVTEGIYMAVNEMLTRTMRKQRLDPNFDADAIMNESLKRVTCNPESIEAIKYYDATKVIFDPCSTFISDDTEYNPRESIRDYLTGKTNDYNEAFKALYDLCTAELLDKYLITSD